MRQFFTLTILLAATTSKLYAFDIALLLSNHTDLVVTSKGNVNYETTDGANIWGESLAPTQVEVPGKTDYVPQDKLRTDLTHYDLEYFDIYNQDGKLLTSCMDDYLGISHSTLIKFDLFAYGQAPVRYECHRVLISG